MGRLLFLGASVSQVAAIRRARELGHLVVAVDGDAAAVGFADADVAEAVDFSDVERVADVARRHAVEAVLAISTDRAVVPAARLAALLGLPGVDPEVAVAMTDKTAMRARLAAAGVPQPGHAVVRGAADLEAAAVPLPAVVKPSDSGGQRGIFLVSSLDEAARRLPEALALTRNGAALVEEYVEGIELNGLFVVRDGEPTLVTLSDRLRPPGRGFGVGWIHSFPSSLPSKALAEAERVSCAAIRALGLRDGIAFPQLIARPDGRVVLVEIAARIAAGQMADLVRHGTGIDLYAIAFDLALGRPVSEARVTPLVTRPIAIRFLTAAPGVLPVGVVERVEGLERVQAAEGVLAAGLYFGPGARIRPVQVDADRSGYVIATAETPERALELADRASRLLTVRTRRRRGWDVGLVAAILVACAAAFAVSESAKLQRALVGGTRVVKQFSPSCGCPEDAATIAFRVLRRAPVTVRIVDRAGRAVDTLRRDAVLPVGRRVTVRWRGLDALGRTLPDGAYRPEVSFPTLRRTLVLPSPILLDTRRPRVLRAALRRLRHGVLVDYRFGEQAHAELLVDGRRTVYTRSSRPSGQLRWTDRLPRTARRLAISLVAVDPAGNRSLPRRLPG